MKARMQRDSQGLAALLRSQGMQKAMSRVSTDVLLEAERRAPRGRTGVYAESFLMEEGPITVSTKHSGVRAGVRIRNTAPHSPAVDFRHSFVLGGLAGRKPGRRR